MNDYEIVAAGVYLCHWPDNIDFVTLIQRLKNEDFGEEYDAIEIAFHVDGYPGEFIADLIMDLNDTLQRTFKVTHELN